MTSVLNNNRLTIALLLVGFGLSIATGAPLDELPSLVDWQTITTLSGLLIVTMGIKQSGLFYYTACRISRHLDDERLLALFLVFLAALLSMFLTNDIALFVVVPLTLSLQDIAGRDYGRMIIFEAIAVNAGSSLTPIGNPQNIFLWHQWGISFPAFMGEMAPLVLIMAGLLLVMTLLCFPSRTININMGDPVVVDRRLFVLSALLLVAFTISVEWQYGRYFLPVIMAVFLVYRRKILVITDWGLIVLFMVVFIDLNLALQLKAVQRALTPLDFGNVSTLFLSGAFFSQAISNVPSAILLTNYSAEFKVIAYGVAIGGNGLLIGSFANLIALRFIAGPSKYLAFHYYSLPYFLGSLILTYYILI